MNNGTNNHALENQYYKSDSMFMRIASDMLAAIVEVVKADYGQILRVSADSNAVSVQAATGKLFDVMGYLHTDADSFVQHVLSSQTPTVVEDWATESRFGKLVLSQGQFAR